MRQCILMQKDRWMDGGAGEPRTEEQGVAFVVPSLSRVRLFVTPWAAACQASLSFAIFQSLLKLMSTESVMPSNHLIFCCPFSSCTWSFPASREDLIPLSHHTQPSVPCGKFPGQLCCCTWSLNQVRLCNSMDCSLTGSSVHEIFQARILEQVAISFSRESSRPRDQT